MCDNESINPQTHTLWLRPLEKKVSLFGHERSVFARVLPNTEEGKLLGKVSSALRDMLRVIHLMPDYTHPVLQKEIKQTSEFKNAMDMVENIRAYELKLLESSSSSYNAADMSSETKCPP